MSSHIVYNEMHWMCSKCIEGYNKYIGLFTVYKTVDGPGNLGIISLLNICYKNIYLCVVHVCYENMCMYYRYGR